VFTDNEVDHNGWAGYDGPEGVSGAKFSAADHLTINYNTFHDNTGNGLWMDVQTENVSVTGNVMARNHTLNNEGGLAGGYGIQIEHSCHIALQDNTISGNDRSAINSTNPWDLSISGNTISGNGRGIHLVDDDRPQPAGACNPRGGEIRMRDVVVSENDITMAVGYSGFVTEVVLLDPSNRFTNNTYNVPSCREPWWVLGDDEVLLTWFEWQAALQDVSGTCRG
jgi:parallel beta-helix repeat protein